MIPILNIGTAVTSVLAFVVAFRLRASYLQTRDSTVHRFARAYLLLSLYFALQSLPALVLANPFHVQIEYIVAMTVVHITVTTLALVSLDISGKPHWKKPFVILMLFLIPLSVLLQAFNFHEAEIKTLGNLFYYWADGSPVWVHAINGSIVSIILLFTTALFFRASRTLETAWLRRRSLILGLGFLSFFLAAFFWILLTPLLSLEASSTISGLAAVSFSVVGILLVLTGILYREKEETKSV